ncbi:MAG: hypothetical protein Q9157_005826, partial [Trypethelium eluteriae]
MVQKLTGSGRETPRDVEAPPPIESTNAIVMTQEEIPKAEEGPDAFGKEDYNDIFVIGDDAEDPFTDDFEKDRPSVTESISKAYFEGQDERTEHRPLTPDSYYGEDFQAPRDDACGPSGCKDNGGWNAMNAAQDYQRPPSYNPYAAPWRISVEQTSMSADI